MEQTFQTDDNDFNTVLYDIDTSFYFDTLNTFNKDFDNSLYHNLLLNNSFANMNFLPPLFNNDIQPFEPFNDITDFDIPDSNIPDSNIDDSNISDSSISDSELPNDDISHSFNYQYNLTVDDCFDD